MSPHPTSRATDGRPPVFLCERCGYDLTGLTETCPECGVPVEESLPTHRVGSPYQRSPGVRTLLLTWHRAVFHRRELFRELRVDGAGATRLAVISAAVAPSLALLGALIAVLAFLHIASHLTLLWFTAWAIAVSMVLAPVLLGLTLFEAWGVRFFGTRRGWRITKPLAWTIVAHGGVGWVIAGASLGLGLACLALGNAVGGLLVGTAAGHWAPWLVKAGNAGLGLCAGLGVPGGFLLFEWFAYAGVRACRYANPPDAAVPDGLLTGGAVPETEGPASK